MSDILFADTEGNDLLPGLTKMWTIQIAEGVEGEVEVYADQPGYPPLREGLKRLKEADKIVAHNGVGYDLFAINKLYPGTLRVEQIIDTLILSRLRNAKATRHSLKEIGEIMGYHKGGHEDFSKFSDAMVVYGKRDVRILQKMWAGDPVKKFPSFGAFYERYTRAYETERDTAYVIQKQINHGFRFDFDKAVELEIVLRQENLDTQRELQRIFPPIITERYSEKQFDKITGKPKRLKDDVEVFNPGSRDQIAQRLIDKYDWKPRAKTEGGKVKIDEDILDELDYPEARPCANFLKLTKKIGQLAEGDNAWLKVAQKKPDGTYYAHGYVNPIGARTHRMSHSKPNLAQVDSDHRMRELWVPDRGHVLVGVDAEGLELRMLAHYLFMYDQGAYSTFVHAGDKKLGTDVHTMNRKAAGLYLRDSAKTMIYAHNYGCGDAKLGRIVRDDAKAAEQEAPKGSDSKIGKELRAKLEAGVTGLGDLIKKCKGMHERKASLPGLDGRTIPSASAHSALNTLLQGNGSVVMKVALNEFDREITRLMIEDQIGYCANVHDEYQISAHPDVAEKVAEVGKWSIMRAGEILEVRCPLVGDAKIGNSWAETH